MSLFHSIAASLFRLLRVREIATRRYLRTCNHTIQAGPFHGMRYVKIAHCSALAPKLAGAYERELNPYMARLAAAQPDLFVDIGAAEGYYAVGAAFAGWSPRIVAYESDAAARDTLRDLQSLNNLPLERIDLREACTIEDLAALLATARRPAVILDAEGFEALLVDPLRIPPLRHTLLLLEYHDFILPGLSDELRRRLQDTHHIESIIPAPRHASELAGADRLLLWSPALCRLLLSELRPLSQHGWLWFVPKNLPLPGQS